MSQVFIGDDWAEGHHDIHVMDGEGRQLKAGRLDEGVAGISRLHQILADVEARPEDVVVGIETDRGLWVNALVAAGYQVFAINPLSAARYRDRHRVTGAKSDRADAKLLADVVRTDRHNQRTVAQDSDLVEGIKTLARAHQNLIWARVRHTNQLRSALREYHPAALEVFDDLAHPEALSVLQRFPSPQAARGATIAQIRAALRQAGRRRNLETRAAAVKQGLRVEHLEAPEPVAEAFSAATKAQVTVIATMNEQIAVLQDKLEDTIGLHPAEPLMTSLPGMGTVLASRILGEFGDDPGRYATAKARKNYAGTSPLTVASGKKHTVTARYVRNRRLCDAVDQWAFCSITRSPGCRHYYDARRSAGDSHHQALRALGNRLVGILHGCLRHGTLYDESAAWGHRNDAPSAMAA